MKKVLVTTTLATLLSAGAIAMSASSASAEVVCNNNGDCWHTKDHYTYPPGATITVHPDEWKWEDKDKDHYRFHEHEGRGYWRGGVWIGF